MGAGRGGGSARRAGAARARWSGRLTAALALALPLLAAGCGGFLRHYDLAPNGLERPDYELRLLLSQQLYDTAYARVRSDRYAPGDDLLKRLYTGLIAHYAGRHEDAARAFEQAANMADDRYTKSVARGALALVTSDYALKYEPSATERLLLPYYAGLDYLAAGDVAGAAVEARRIGSLLERARDDGDAVDPALVRFLRYFSGAAFEASGDRNDAAVAYRNAAVEPADSAPGATPMAGRPLGSDSGAVVVFVERGFVAHRVERGLLVPLGVDQATTLASGGDDARFATATAIAASLVARTGDDSAAPSTADPAARVGFDPACDNAADIAVRRAPGARPDSAAGPVVDLSAPADRRPDPGCRSFRGYDTSPAYILHVAWPTYQRHDGGPPTLPLVGSDAGDASALLGVDVSAAVIGDFQRELPLLLARTIARAATKYALGKAIKEQVSKKDKTLGEVAGALADVGAVLSERADTRSWTLLPARISVVRLTLAAGDHALWIEPDGTISSADVAATDPAGPAAAGVAPLGTVHVTPGGVAVLSTRLWY